MIVQGTTVELELALALRLLARAGASGIVTLHGGDGHRAQIVLADGAVLHATSTGTSKLGESLVERGVITPEVLADALRHQRRKKVRQPLATILAELGVVSKSMAEAEVETQIVRVLRDVFAGSGARLTFEAAPIDRANILCPESCTLEALLGRLAWTPAGS